MTNASTLPWAQDLAARARTALVTPDLPERPWMVMGVTDHLTLYSDRVIAKVARPGEHWAARLRNDVAVSLELADAGYPVRRPLLDAPLETELGTVTLWPYVRHNAAATFTPDVTRALGKTLGRLTNHRAGPITSPPFEHLDERLHVGSGAVPNADLAALTDLARTAYNWAVDIGAWDDGHLAHSDVSIHSTLLRGDDLTLIDLDGADLWPAGWDLAVLLLRINLQAYDPEAAAAAAEGWAEHAPVPDAETLAALMAVKLVKSTAYSLLHAATDPAHRQLFTDRIAVLTGPLERRELPPFIPVRARYLL